VGDTETVEFGTFAESCWRTVATSEATLDVETDRTLVADRSRLQQLLTSTGTPSNTAATT
jgi:hypothetical protein